MKEGIDNKVEEKIIIIMSSKNKIIKYLNKIKLFWIFNKIKNNKNLIKNSQIYKILKITHVEYIKNKAKVNCSQETE